MDCDKSNGGCRGGHYNYAFKYNTAKGGEDSQESYPYEGRDMKCRNEGKEKYDLVSGFKRVLSNKSGLISAL